MRLYAVGLVVHWRLCRIIMAMQPQRQDTMVLREEEEMVLLTPVTAGRKISEKRCRDDICIYRFYCINSSPREIVDMYGHL